MLSNYKIFVLTGLRLLIMDKKEPGKEVSEDVTRESLIAISYREPDITAKGSPKSIKGKNVVEPILDADEKYRSKLISISSSTSRNVKVQPALPGQPDP